MSKSTHQKRSCNHQNAKPYKDFPLTAHPSGRWCKKIRGRTHYFGPIDDHQAALDKWLKEKDALLAGRVPRSETDGRPLLGDLCNKFLHSKQLKVDSLELAEVTWRDYKRITDELVGQFGRDRLLDDIRPEDFEKLRSRLAKKWGPVTLLCAIGRTRGIFKYALNNGLIEKPVLFGQGFDRPSKKTLRKARAAKGVRMFEPAELHRILDAAGQPLKAMILLGINCGFGNSDCGRLPEAALHLDRGWVSFARPKTGVDRRCPLWPETIEAIREAIALRPKAKTKAAAGLVFVTKFGESWAKEVFDNPISKQMTRLLKELGLHRPGLGFYSLRHTFETIGGDSRDQVATDHIMGHGPADDDMSSVYREKIEDARLKSVTDHVRRWLFAEPAPETLPFQMQKNIG